MSGDAALAAVIATLDRLVAFDTESAKSNLGLIDHVAAVLDGYDIPWVRLPNPTGEKAALLATIGPTVDGGVVLSGHTDVVPVAGQDWASDPFSLRREGDRLYGRGACDMKGFLACCLALAPELKALDLKRPVHLLFSYDEETTCLGVMDAIAAFGVRLPRPAAVIVGEPTLMRVADAHKSVVTFHTRVTGFEAHSSRPESGVNAVLVAAKLVVQLDALGAAQRALGDATGRFDPPHTTVHVGTFAGGTARNIVPKDATSHWEFRGVPGLDDAAIPDALAAFADRDVLPAMRAVFPGAAVETTEEINVPALAPDPGSAAETLALRLTRSNETITVAYGSEAGRFQRAGFPTVLCGPGSIDQAHKPDEWITLGELERCMAFVRGLGAELAG